MRIPITDSKGITYPSIAAACKAYGIYKSTFDKRVKSGLSRVEALEMTVRQIRDPLTGEIYSSVKKMCNAYNLPVSTYYKRLYNGYTIAQALSMPRKEAWIDKGKIRDHKGNSYRTIKSMCNAYGLYTNLFRNRIKKGWTLQEALETPIQHRKRAPRGNGIVKDPTTRKIFPSVEALCEAYSIDRVTYISRIRRGWKPKDALLTPVRTYKKKDEIKVMPTRKTRIVDPVTRKEYPSVQALCDKYGIKKSTYVARVRRGWKKKAALLTPVRPYVLRC